MSARIFADSHVSATNRTSCSKAYNGAWAGHVFPRALSGGSAKESVQIPVGVPIWRNTQYMDRIESNQVELSPYCYDAITCTGTSYHISSNLLSDSKGTEALRVRLLYYTSSPAIRSAGCAELTQLQSRHIVWNEHSWLFGFWPIRTWGACWKVRSYTPTCKWITL